jgi:hypothetical protein
MKLLRTLFVASTALVLSATMLSAQDTQVTCKDGAKSKGGRGACSGHGGIAVAAKAEAKADAKATKADIKSDTKAEAKADKAELKVAKHHKKAKKAKA